MSKHATWRREVENCRLCTEKLGRCIPYLSVPDPRQFQVLSAGIRDLFLPTASPGSPQIRYYDTKVIFLSLQTYLFLAALPPQLGRVCFGLTGTGTISEERAIQHRFAQEGRVVIVCG
jgi:hypothetical protein